MCHTWLLTVADDSTPAQCRYNMVNFLQNSRKRYTINLWFIFCPSSLQWCMQCLIIMNRVTMARNCIEIPPQARLVMVNRLPMPAAGLNTNYCLPMRKKLATVTAHAELTVTKMVTASRERAETWAVIEQWPSCDWAVIILKRPWLSCDIAVTDLWPCRDWAVTSQWPLLAVTEPWSLGPRAVTTVVTVTIYFLMGQYQSHTYWSDRSI